MTNKKAPESTPFGVKKERVKKQRFPMSPFPSGWYLVATSDDLANKGVMPLRLFGLDLVLFRTESGRAVLMDAHCPHLGAHLGHGGIVVKENIQCPFHGWQFSADGACAAVPGAKRNPTPKPLNCWNLQEKNGAVLAYFHPEGLPPTWEISEIKGNNLLPFTLAARYKLNSHIQETNENSEDIAHFAFLHSQHTTENKSKLIKELGAKLVHATEATFKPVALGGLDLFAIPGTVTFTHEGLGLLSSKIEVKTPGLGTIQTFYVNFYSTPTETESINFTVLVSGENVFGQVVTRLALAIIRRHARFTIDQDVPIWNNKVYRERPILSDADGPILRYRKWARQFSLS